MIGSFPSVTLIAWVARLNINRSATGIHKAGRLDAHLANPTQKSLLFSSLSRLDSVKAGIQAQVLSKSVREYRASCNSITLSTDRESAQLSFHVMYNSAAVFFDSGVM